MAKVKPVKEYRAKFVPRANCASKSAGVYQDLIAYQFYLSMRNESDPVLDPKVFQKLYPYLAEFLSDNKHLI